MSAIVSSNIKAQLIKTLELLQASLANCTEYATTVSFEDGRIGSPWNRSDGASCNHQSPILPLFVHGKGGTRKTKAKVNLVPQKSSAARDAVAI
jgi:hypothetical protein